MSGISLALSGGGIRAMVFHLGVMRHLAENGLMEHVERISSVSGGSLVTGLILKEADMRWPGSQEFLTRVYPALREKLCSRSLMWGMVRQLAQRENWKHLLYRANILAAALHKEWGVSERLSALPEKPEISFEGTTAENGKRFRFKRDTFGDYELGYAQSSAFPLASALAVSAAFPGGIGAFELRTDDYQWKKAENWDDPDAKTPVTLAYRKLHLYDGGVYDNLGLEPFFDAGCVQPKTESGFLLVSDAGSPFTRGFSYTSLNPMRLKRVLDIVMEQCRSLRIRGLRNYLSQTTHAGSYMWLNTTLKKPEHREYSDFASSFPTTLRKLSEKEFDGLSQHGYFVGRECLGKKAAASIKEKSAEKEILPKETDEAAL